MTLYKANMNTTPPQHNQVFIGTFIHSKALDELEYLHDTAVFVDGPTGKIVAVEAVERNGGDHGITSGRLAETFTKLGWSPSEVKTHDTIRRARAGEGDVSFFFPGFVDTHIHASQYPNVGIFGKSTLLHWLKTYTFPLEAGLGADLAKARRVYARCVRRTLSHGTTTAAYYATVDVAATNILLDTCLARGQRALVGRVCMDEPRTCPPGYRDESAAQALSRTRECLAHARAADPRGDLVRHVVTPRFAPACSREAMRGLGDLAREEGLAVQTHVSENKVEIDMVREMFPAEFGRGGGGGGYPGVYDAFGLLGPRTILAHGVHLTEGEADLVAARGAKVSHCPCSNSAITSGAARVRWLMDRGIDVGLGTDVSGGYSASVLEAARQASLVSRHVAMGGDERAKLSVEEVLYLATRGGARCVGLEARVGAFEVGMDWDAQLVRLDGVREGEGEDEGEQNADGGNVDVFGWESWEEMVAKWLFNGDDRNTRKVWVKGRLVHERV